MDDQPANDEYVVVPLAVVNEPALSMRARGVLLWMLAQPAGSALGADAVAAAAAEGRDAIRSAFRELEAAGYVSRERRQNAAGRWGTETVVHVTPQRLRGDTAAAWHVYRLYDTDGELLYVGMTGSLADRLRHHRIHTPFHRVTWVEYATRSAAEAAEAVAITSERPPLNIAGR